MTQTSEVLLSAIPLTATVSVYISLWVLSELDMWGGTYLHLWVFKTEFSEDEHKLQNMLKIVSLTVALAVTLVVALTQALAVALAVALTVALTVTGWMYNRKVQVVCQSCGQGYDLRWQNELVSVSRW